MHWWHQYLERQPIRLRTLVEPAVEPVLSSEARDHLHLTEGSEDAEVAMLYAAAREHVEEYTGRRIIARKVRQSYDRFPWGKVLLLAESPLLPTSTSHPAPVVRYFTQNSSGSSGGSVLASTLYVVNRDRDPPAIVLKRDGEFPTVELRNADGVHVDYWVGYSTSSTGAPAWSRAAINLVGAHWFANREAVVQGTVATEVPMSAQRIMQMHRSPLAQV